MASSVPTFELNSGARIPAIGFGTFSFSLMSENPIHQLEQFKTAVIDAITLGYRHFDTAPIYGTEASLGEALAEAFRNELVTRQEIFVTSKLWCSDHEPVDAARSLSDTLRDLRLDYVDLFLIHWPVKLKKCEPKFHIVIEEDEFLPLDLKSTWSAMEKAFEEGYTKSIGVSNFSTKKLGEILSYAKIRPAVNQVEFHPGWQQKQLRDFCNKEHIHITGWSPLGAPWMVWRSESIIDNPVIKYIAKTHCRAPAQVLLRWAVELGVSVVPKSFNKDRMKQNLEIFDWQLSEDEHEEMRKIKQEKIMKGEWACNESSSPYRTLEDLWDGEI